MALFSESDLEKMGAKPAWGTGSAGNYDTASARAAGAQVGDVRPIESINYVHPNGARFAYREPGPGIGYSSSGHYEQISGPPMGGASETPESLLASGKYRDIPGNVMQDYNSGRVGLAETVAAIKGTPVYNPTLGPQVNYGQGNVPFTGTFNPPTISPASFYAQNSGNKVLNSETTKPPASPTPFTTPPPIAPYPVSSLNANPGETFAQYEARLGFQQGGATGVGTSESTPTTGLTPEQTDIQKRISDLMAGYDAAAGRSAYQSTQENSQDVLGKYKIINDLENQLNAIKAEATAIPLSPAGVNVNSSMLGAQERELLHQNALKALTVSVQLEAAKGNLTLAQHYADRLTEQKYGPIEANNKAALANIDLLLKSPQYTKDEKDQAEARAVQLKQVSDTIAESKTNTKDIMSILADPDFQTNAPADIKKQLSDLAQKPNPTQADVIQAQSIGAQYKASITYETRSVNGREVRFGFQGSRRVSKQDLGVAGSGGTNLLTPVDYSRLNSIGLDRSLADAITAEVLSGVSKADIKAKLKQYGQDPSLADKFDNVVGIDTINKNSTISIPGITQ